MHISFSLDGQVHRANPVVDTSFGNDLINFFLTSVGATLTEIRDVDIRFVCLYAQQRPNCYLFMKPIRCLRYLS